MGVQIDLPVAWVVFKPSLVLFDRGAFEFTMHGSVLVFDGKGALGASLAMDLDALERRDRGHELLRPIIRGGLSGAVADLGR